MPAGRAKTLSVSKLRRRSEAAVPTVVDELSRQSGIVGLEWRCPDQALSRAEGVTLPRPEIGTLLGGRAGLAGNSHILRLDPKFFGTKGIWRRLASRHRLSEARHVRGFAGRFRDFWPRAARSAAPVHVGTSSAFAGRKPFGGAHASPRLPVIVPAALLCPLTCVFISPIMHRTLAVATMRRASQSPAFGVLYADR